jgi:uncharacterized protein YndB with AHSA1/START domain
MSTPKGGLVRSSIVIERTFRTRVEELWALWTTKEGFESWWGGEGSRVEVHSIEARKGGTLHYRMIALVPEAIGKRQQLGLAPSSSVLARYQEFNPYRRLVLAHIVDFVPGAAPYESTIAVEFFQAVDRVRMLTTIEPMHNDEFTQTSVRVFMSQLKLLEARFRGQ